MPKHAPAPATRASDGGRASLYRLCLCGTQPFFGTATACLQGGPFRPCFTHEGCCAGAYKGAGIVAQPVRPIRAFRCASIECFTATAALWCAGGALRGKKRMRAGAGRGSYCRAGRKAAVFWRFTFECAAAGGAAGVRSSGGRTRGTWLCIGHRRGGRSLCGIGGAAGRRTGYGNGRAGAPYHGPAAVR